MIQPDSTRKIVTLDDIERRLISEHRKPYADWLRHVVSLSSGALTLLVGLQSQYVPKIPKDIWILKCCWCFLALAVLAGLYALRAEWQTPLDACRDIQRRRLIHGDEATALYLEGASGHDPRSSHALSRKGAFVAFSSAIVFLTLFAVRNLG